MALYDEYGLQTIKRATMNENLVALRGANDCNLSSWVINEKKCVRRVGMAEYEITPVGLEHP